MPRPRLEDSLAFYTVPHVAAELGLTPDKVVRWIKAGILPPPSLVRDGLRLFDQWWIASARRALAQRKS